MPDTSKTVCRNITQFQEDLEKESHSIDSLLQHLQKYYSTVKTKRQLNLEVPAGFRQSSLHKRNLSLLKQLSKLPDGHHILQESTQASDLGLETNPLSTIDHSQQDSLQDDTHISSSTVFSPIVRSVDKPSSSLPHTIRFLEGYLHLSVGFRRIDSMKQHFQNLYQDTIKLDSMPADAVLDLGNYATMRK